MSEFSKGYQAFLMRIWPVHNEVGVVWRVLITNAHTGEKHGFASLKEMFNFLEIEVCQVAQSRTKPRMDGKRGDAQA